MRLGAALSSGAPPRDGLSPDFDWEPYVRAAAPVLGFDLDPEQIGATAGWLRSLAALAAPLLTDPIPDRSESAPVFQA